MQHLNFCSYLVFNTFLGKHGTKTYVVHGLLVLADFELINLSGEVTHSLPYLNFGLTGIQTLGQSFVPPEKLQH
jgi:hypothetical protein